MKLCKLDLTNYFHYREIKCQVLVPWKRNVGPTLIQLSQVSWGSQVTSWQVTPIHCPWPMRTCGHQWLTGVGLCLCSLIRGQGAPTLEVATTDQTWNKRKKFHQLNGSEYKCPLTEELRRCGTHTQWNTTQPRKRMKSCHLQQHEC